MYYSVLFVLIPTLAAQQMSLCEYLHQLGRTDPYCLEHRKSEFATTEGSRLAKMIAILEEREAQRKAISFRTSKWALCKTKEFKQDCREDKSSCESGYSCLSEDDDGRCCISTTANVLLPSNPSACPSPGAMGYTCSYGNKRAVTNWCQSDSDCSAGSVHLCCDTGCGYNICLPSTGHVLDNGVRSIENDRCPPTALLNVKCRMSSRRSTNWCNTDRECQVSYNYPRDIGGYQWTGSDDCCWTPFGYLKPDLVLMLTGSSVPQSCCPTSCGYNACVANDGYQLAFG